MMHLPPRPSRRLVALIAILLVLNSCYAWTHHPPQTMATVMTGEPDRVRVMRTGDPERMVLHDPRMAGDGVAGMTGPWRSRALVSIRLTDLASVETRSLDPLRTIGAGLGAAVVTFGVVTVLVLLSLDCFTVDEPCHP